MSLIENITIGQYLPLSSPLHRLDPRTKLFAALCLILLAAVFFNPLLFLILNLVLLFTYLLARLPAQFLWRNTKGFSWFFAFTFLVHLFFTSGQPIFQLWFLKPSGEGVLKGLFYCLRLSVFLNSAVILAATTTPLDFAEAFEKTFSFLKKFKIPISELTLIFTIALRFIPILFEELITLKRAQQARGITYSGNPFKRARHLSALLLPLFLNTFRRADELAVAMEVRGFRVGAERSHLRELSLGRQDRLVFAGVSFFFLFTCFLILS